MKRRIGLLCLTLALAAFVALSGCSSSSESSGASSGDVGSSSSAAVESSQSESTASSENSAASSGVAATSTSSSSSAAAQSSLPNGEYEVDVATDSSMFHLNESVDGKGILTVSDGGMSVHMTLTSKKITTLYAGKVAQAETDEAGWIQPTSDTVTYDDGITEEVYGFDVPVPVLDEPFDVAILGSKGNWYDHTVTVSSPITK